LTERTVGASGRLGPRRVPWMWIGAILLAFALRIWRLGDQSLRGDEAFDVIFVQRPVSAILEALRSDQPYPPGFHLFFKGWVQLMGRSEFALRFPAAWCATLMMPLAYALARLWCGERAAQWTVLLLAWQPLAIWYAQDGRMYAPLMLLALTSTYFAARLWAWRGAGWHWGAYVGSAWLGLMTHYVAALVVGAQLVCGAVLFLRERDRRSLVRWLGAGALVGVANLPWVALAWPLLRSHTSSWVQTATVTQMLWRMLAAYTVGMTLDWRWAAVPVMASVAGVAAACVTLWRARSTRTLLLLLGLLVLPALSVVAVGFRRPMFDERYLVTLVVPLLILVGCGLRSVARWRGAQAVLGALILGGMAFSYGQYRFNGAYAKSPQWRTLFQALETLVRPGDAVVYTFPDPAPEVYADGRWPTFLLPVSVPLDRGDVEQRARNLMREHERVWLIPRWAEGWDPEGTVEEVLNMVGERAAEVRVASWPLVVYHAPQLYQREMVDLDATLGEEIALLGYVLRDKDGGSRDRLEAAPGDAVRLTLYWKALTEVSDDYVVFVHVLDDRGWVRGQQDNQPQGGTYPTKAWSADTCVVDIYHVPVAADAPSGEYALEVGMYRPGDGERLPTSGRDADPAGRRIPLRDVVRVR